MILHPFNMISVISGQWESDYEMQWNLVHGSKDFGVKSEYNTNC